MTAPKAPDGEFESLFRQRAALVGWLTTRGARLTDAEDAAQAAFEQVWRRWPQVRNRRAYLYRVAGNELGGIWKAQSRDDALCRVGRSADRDMAGDVTWLQEQMVRECLLALPGRQRAVLAGSYDGYRDGELAAALGMPAGTVRSHRRHARESLRGLAVLGQDPRGLMLRRAYAEMRGGNPAPRGSRLAISQSWARSALYLASPEHGPGLAR